MYFKEEPHEGQGSNLWSNQLPRSVNWDQIIRTGKTKRRAILDPVNGIGGRLTTLLEEIHPSGKGHMGHSQD